MKWRNGTYIKTFLTILIILVSIFAAGCAGRDAGPEEELEEGIETEPLREPGVGSDKGDFLKPVYPWESGDKYSEIEPEALSYSLPLSTSEITNYKTFSGKIPLDPQALEMLEQNGFVVIERPYAREDITSMYGTLKYQEIPIFITTDSLLHLYHIQFDETLRQVEEREFYAALWELDLALLNASVEEYGKTSGEVKEAARRNAAYFAVALSLLQPEDGQVEKNRMIGVEDDSLFPAGAKEKYSFEVPAFVEEDVEAELALIEAHSGFSPSPLFRYEEDYSQYVPRGHYTRSEPLKNYFRAFMWHGRMSLLLKGKLIKASDPEKEARTQTMQASLIASDLEKSPELLEKWDQIYRVTAFYVGFSDDLGPYEYLEAMDSVFGPEFRPEELNEQNIGELKARLAEYQGPQIYGGTGNCSLRPPFTPAQADECLADTKGFRFMGQRFIPDSYMFSNLVGAYTGKYTGELESGEPEPFTYVISGAGRPIRGFPRGLDVLALLGSERAVYWLEELDDTVYENYSVQYGKLEAEFSEFDEADWNKNLYWAWLYSLQPLLETYGEEYPVFMQSGAWQDKELTTTLASWAELRHDTILYSKQSYTIADTGMPLPEREKPAVGYVEPVPEFYSRLLNLTRMTNRDLDEMGVLDRASKARLESLEHILARLLVISEKELENKELTKTDYAFIKDFGEQLEGVIEEVDEKSKKTTIVADVHTDGNTKSVLEEGVGYVEMLVVAYKVPDGRILVGAGPVFSYYEFKQPMADRLTDEEWREMLRKNPPERPEWTLTYT